MEKRIITSENETQKISEILERCENELLTIYSSYTKDSALYCQNCNLDFIYELMKMSTEIKRKIHLFADQIETAKERFQNDNH